MGRSIIIILISVVVVVACKNTTIDYGLQLEQNIVEFENTVAYVLDKYNNPEDSSFQGYLHIMPAKKSSGSGKIIYDSGIYVFSEKYKVNEIQIENFEKSFHTTLVRFFIEDNNKQYIYSQEVNKFQDIENNKVRQVKITPNWTFIKEKNEY